MSDSLNKNDYYKRLEYKIKRPPYDGESSASEEEMGDIRVHLSPKTLTENRLMGDIDLGVKKLLCMNTDKLEIFGIGISTLVEGLGYDHKVLINVVNAFSSSISEIGGDI